MKKNDYTLTALIAALCCTFVAVIAITTGSLGITVNGDISLEGTPAASFVPVEVPDQGFQNNAGTVTDKSDNLENDDSNKNESSTVPSDETVSPDSSAPLKSTKEIIDQYTLLVDKFKKEKPAYKKKEYQALPEENRNFSSAINSVLSIAANYMVSEEDCEELIREAGSEEILYDMPIHGTEKGCTLTDYDAVSWAKCEDLGDGTYKISFSLKEEYNAEPTPADTLIAPSAHGGVMQPMAIKDIMTEVNNVVSKLPGINLNGFDLIYRDCVFSCVYDPKTDEVKSITHNIAIDIEADVNVFSADIVGSARLINDMLIYDIVW